MLKSHFADKKDGKTLSVFQEKYLNLHRLFSLYVLYVKKLSPLGWLN